MPTVPPNESVVRFYDAVAGPYDWLVSPLARGTRERAIELIDVVVGETVLEVGCGPGRALVKFADRVGPDGAVIGLDAAPGMLAQSRVRLERSGIGDRVSLTLGDARELPFRDQSVDVVFVEDTLELFAPPDRRRVLNEIHRVLVPDGRLGVVTMDRRNEGFFLSAYEWMYEHVPGVGRVGCRPIMGRPVLEANGFVVIERRDEKRGGVWPTAIYLAERAN